MEKLHGYGLKIKINGKNFIERNGRKNLIEILNECKNSINEIRAEGD